MQLNLLKIFGKKVIALKNYNVKKLFIFLFFIYNIYIYKFFKEALFEQTSYELRIFLPNANFSVLSFKIADFPMKS